MVFIGRFSKKRCHSQKKVMDLADHRIRTTLQLSDIHSDESIAETTYVGLLQDDDVA